MRAVDPDLDGRGSFLLAAALREAAEGLPEGCRALLVGQPRVAAVAVRLSHLHCPFLWETADTGQIRALLGAHLEPVLSAFGRPATPGHPTRRTGTQVAGVVAGPHALETDQRGILVPPARCTWRIPGPLPPANRSGGAPRRMMEAR